MCSSDLGSTDPGCNTRSSTTPATETGELLPPCTTVDRGVLDLRWTTVHSPCSKLSKTKVDGGSNSSDLDLRPDEPTSGEPATSALFRRVPGSSTEQTILATSLANARFRILFSPRPDSFRRCEEPSGGVRAYTDSEGDTAAGDTGDPPSKPSEPSSSESGEMHQNRPLVARIASPHISRSFLGLFNITFLPS